MSYVWINVQTYDDTEQRRTAPGKQKRKNKALRKKMQYLETKGDLERKHSQYRGESGCDQTPLHNGAPPKHPPPPTFAQNKGLPCLADRASTSHCSSGPSTSTHSMPSFSVTVNSKGSHGQPKKPVNEKSIGTCPGPSVSSNHQPMATSSVIPAKYLAIDCEMVGVGPKGSISQLARCSIVSYEGDVVYDKFIKPSMPVTDFRTRWSGIRRSDLTKAIPYSQAKKEILKLLMGKVVVGHAIHNDFKVLGYTHPSALTRDTSRIPLLNRKAGFGETECASLKRLTKAIFNRDIQAGKKGHSSVEDAKATMELYKVVEEEWERRLASRSQAS